MENIFAFDRRNMSSRYKRAAVDVPALLQPCKHACIVRAHVKSPVLLVAAQRHGKSDSPAGVGTDRSGCRERKRTVEQHIRNMTKDIERSGANARKDFGGKRFVSRLKFASVGVGKVERSNEVLHAARGFGCMAIEGRGDIASFARLRKPAVGVVLSRGLDGERLGLLVIGRVHRQSRGGEIKRGRLTVAFNLDRLIGSRKAAVVVFMNSRYGAGEIHRYGRAEVAFRRSNVGGKERVFPVRVTSRALDHDVIGVSRTVKFKRKPPVGSFNVIAFNINRADAVARSKRSVVGKRIYLVKGIS